MGLFGQGKGKDPKELVREWQSKLRKEERAMERQVLGIQREEQKVTRSLKEAAKKGDKDVCKILAREVVNSRKAINKLYAAKAQIKSVEYGMTQQLAVLRTSGALKQSADVMKSMQQLCKVSEVSAVMRDLSKEMMKAGLIEEMLEDTMEGITGDDDLEMDEEVEKEVDKVLFDLTAGVLGTAPHAVDDSLPVPERRKAAAATATAVEDDADDDVTEMQARLEALRS